MIIIISIVRLVTHSIICKYSRQSFSEIPKKNISDLDHVQQSNVRQNVPPLKQPKKKKKNLARIILTRGYNN